MPPRPDSASSTNAIELAERVDRKCLEFEDALRRGEAPRLETWLDKAEPAEREMLFEELLRVERAYAGTGRDGSARNEYLARFPEFAQVIRRNLPADPQPPRFQPGEMVGRYQVQEVLGRGAFGTVYAAFDPELSREVALKLPLEDIPLEAEVADSLLAEARLAASLDHPGIVQVFDVLQLPDRTPVIVMQRIDGQSLREQLARGPLTRCQAVELVILVAQAIEHAHRAGVVHRDLEPRNILIDSSGHPRVSDFGLAIHESMQAARAGESAGSLAYMSPEQIRGDSHWLDGRADIWALGVILYELLTGRRPFVGESIEEVSDQILARDPRPLRQIDPTIPARLEEICLRCLAKAPQGRFPTAKDLADALGVALHHDLESAAHTQVARLPQPPAHRARRAVVGVLSALAVLLLAGLGVSRLRPTPPPLATRIELAIWSADGAFRGRIGRSDLSAAPLRSGDRIRLEVVFNRPVHCRLVWIGADGDVTPLAPWVEGDWQRTGEISPVTQVSLPAAADEMWLIEPGSAGTESLVVLAAEEPLPPDLDVRELMRDVRPQLGTHDPRPRWFENGKLLASPLPLGETAPSRSPRVTQSERIPDEAISNQLLLARRLAATGVQVWALVCPITE